MKDAIVNFINRYHLSGDVEKVLLICKDKTLTTKFISSDESNVGQITAKNINLEDCELPIIETSNLLRILKVLDGDVKIKVSYDEEIPVNLTLNDANVTSRYALGSKDILPETRELDEDSFPTEFDATIEINESFINQFTRYQSALKKCDVFSLVSNGKNLVLVFNYSKNTNEDNFMLPIKHTGNLNKFNHLIFSAPFLKQILNANRDCQGKIEISKEGIAQITLENKEVSCTYYMIAALTD